MKLTLDIGASSSQHVLEHMIRQLADQPEEPVLIHGIAAILLHLDHTALALSLYRNLIIRTGDVALFEPLLAATLLGEGDLEQAEPLLDQAFALSAKIPFWQERFCLWQEVLAEIHWRRGAFAHCQSLLEGLAARHLPYFKAHRPDQLRRFVREAEQNNPQECNAPSQAIMNVIVWGALYADYFLQQLLATLHAPGNLAEITARRQVTLLICCDDIAEKRLSAAPELQSLRGMLTLSFYPLPTALVARTQDPKLNTIQQTINKLRLVAAGHEIGLRLAAARRADFFALYPDWLLSCNYFATLLDALDQGHPAIMALGIPSKREDFIPQFAQMHQLCGLISWTPTALAQMGIRHLHPCEQQHIVAQDQLYSAHRPNRLFWSVGADGMIIHSAHWYVAAAAGNLLSHYRGDVVHGVDQRLIDSLLASGADWKKILYIQDTKNFSVVGLNPGTSYVDYEGKASLWDCERLARHLIPGALLWELSSFSMRQMQEKRLTIPPSQFQETSALDSCQDEAIFFISQLQAWQKRLIKG